MAFDPRIHHRRSIRLRGHDYAAGGAYFVTICTRGKEFLFGEIIETAMVANEAAGVVERIWKDLGRRFPSLVTDAFQMMPNHLHAVCVICGPGLEPALAQATGAPIIQPSSRQPVGPGLAPASYIANVKTGASAQRATTQGTKKAGASPGPTLGQIVGAFKSLSAIAVNRLLARQGQHLWQEDYFEHIIRDVGDLQTIQDYIIHNPQRWLEDPENPEP